ncbi:MAG TPA: hypothetical protein VIC57_08470 [Candidatus Dormibacteraeota bacterium]
MRWHRERRRIGRRYLAGGAALGGMVLVMVPLVVLKRRNGSMVPTGGSPAPAPGTPQPAS